MSSPSKRKASRMIDGSPASSSTEPAEGGATARARRHLPLHNNNPFRRHHREAFLMNKDTSPDRTKQVERDFAMVLAAMPHDRTGIPTNTEGITSASMPKKPPPGSSMTTIAEVATSNGSKDSTSGRNTNGGSNSNFSTPGKKRPYRRTKRPKDYCGLSTITTATPTKEDEKPNVYDMVLDEAEDLLRAALDAQGLGRLKMANNYLLLLHTRLVGLGIKFDRAKVVETSAEARALEARSAGKTPTRTPTRAGAVAADIEDAAMDESSPAAKIHIEATPKKPPATPSKNNSHIDKSPSEQSEPANSDHVSPETQGSPVTPAKKQISPLAHGAPEISAKKPSPGPAHGPPETPDKKRSPVAQTPPTKTTPYEPPPSNGVNRAALNQLKNFMVDQGMLMDQTMVEHLARAAAELHQKRGGKKASEGGLLQSPIINTEEVFNYNKDKKKDAKSEAAPSILNSWTEDEQKKFQDAVDEFEEDGDEVDAGKIARRMKTRTKKEVQACLDQIEANEMEETPRKRGGRGRKPPTTAMFTVANANLDVKALLNEDILKF